MKMLRRDDPINEIMNGECVLIKLPIEDSPNKKINFHVVKATTTTLRHECGTVAMFKRLYPNVRFYKR